MYRINPIIYEIDGEYAGYAAELPGATGQGRTIDEVVREIHEAVIGLIEEYKNRDVDIPWRKTVPHEPLVIET